MKKFKSFFIFAAMFCCSFFANTVHGFAQHQIDTVGSAIVYTNTTLGTTRILPKSSVLVQINSFQNSVGLYTVANQTIFTGRLSSVVMPGPNTVADKINFLKHNVGSTSGSAVCCNNATNLPHKVFRGFFYQDTDDAPLKLQTLENTTGLSLNSVWLQEGWFKLEATIDPTKLYITGGVVDGGKHGYLNTAITNSVTKRTIANYKVNYNSGDGTFYIVLYDDDENAIDFYNFNPDPSIPTKFPFEFYIYN